MRPPSLLPDIFDAEIVPLLTSAPGLRPVAILEEIRRHLAGVAAAYNFGRRLKTSRGLTPYGFIGKCWAAQPERFIINPFHRMPGPNI